MSDTNFLSVFLFIVFALCIVFLAVVVVCCVKLFISLYGKKSHKTLKQSEIESQRRESF